MHYIVLFKNLTDVFPTTEEAELNDLSLHISENALVLDEKNRAKTQNGLGYAHKIPTSGTKAFYEYAQETQGVLADIGCSYGFDTLEALKCGAKVVAIDMDLAHIEHLSQTTPENLKKNLTTMVEHFPGKLEFESGTFDGILLARVLLFLTQEEIELGLQKIFDWLKPGGKVFIVSVTPFVTGWDNAKKIWEEQVLQNHKWPGYIEDLWTAVPETQFFLPKTIQLMDENSLRRALEEAGFVVKKICYEASFAAGQPMICAIARKPDF